jgi:hypothetical protein
MATTMVAGARCDFSNIDSTAAMALVLHRATAHAYRNRPLVRDVSEIFFRLKQRGFRFRDIALRKIPGGFYSEDVEGFVGQLLSMGYASERSPIKLTDKGKTFCGRIVQEEKNQDEMARFKSVLDELLRGWPVAP